MWYMDLAQRESPEWADLLSDMRKRNRLYTAAVPYDRLVGASHAVLTGKEALVRQPSDNQAPTKKLLDGEAASRNTNSKGIDRIRLGC